MNRKRTTTYIFEQQLHAEYWDWEENKKTLFSNWERNKIKIFQEIHRRIKTLEEDIPAKVAFIVHDKDIKYGIKPVEPHIHAYIEFASRRDLSVLASALGLLPQYIEPSGQGKYGKVNSKAYLIHAKSPDKHQYDPSEVETFGTFDYEAFIEDNRADFSKRYAVAKNEDLNQYIRRFNNVLEISKKKGNYDKEKNRFYNLSEVKELNYNDYYQTGYDREIQLHFGEEDIYCTDNKEDIINRVLDEHILPRILLQIKKRPKTPAREKGNA